MRIPHRRIVSRTTRRCPRRRDESGERRSTSASRSRGRPPHDRVSLEEVSSQFRRPSTSHLAQKRPDPAVAPIAARPGAAPERRSKSTVVTASLSAHAIRARLVGCYVFEAKRARNESLRPLAPILRTSWSAFEHSKGPQHVNNRRPASPLESILSPAGGNLSGPPSTSFSPLPATGSRHQHGGAHPARSGGEQR
jgi:hypothetical protein